MANKSYQMFIARFGRDSLLVGEAWVTDTNLYHITDNGATVQKLTLGQGDHGLFYTALSNDYLYYTDSGGKRVWQYSCYTGREQVLASFNNHTWSIAIDKDLDRIFVGVWDEGIYSLDAAGGTPIVVYQYTAGSGVKPFGMSLDPTRK